ncbi:unnamed protein product [Closterium sp. NIES-54]
MKCRWAAAAAFQEVVGRFGCISDAQALSTPTTRGTPHASARGVEQGGDAVESGAEKEEQWAPAGGIAIVNAADATSLSSTRAAFTQVPTTATYTCTPSPSTPPTSQDSHCPRRHHPWTHLRRAHLLSLHRSRQDVVVLLRRHRKQNRVIIPYIKAIAALLQADFFGSLSADTPASDEPATPTTPLAALPGALVEGVELELCRPQPTASVPKMLAAVDLLCHLAAHHCSARRHALSTLLWLLAVRFPTVSAPACMSQQ